MILIILYINTLNSTFYYDLILNNNQYFQYNVKLKNSFKNYKVIKF